MLKFLFRLIGIVVVLVVLLMAVLFYLDTKDLLSGKLERLINALRRLSQEAWYEIRIFMEDAGIAEDAAGLLDQGANFLREQVSPHATEKPGSNALPEGYATASPVPTATPVPTASPVPTATPVVIQ